MDVQLSFGNLNRLGLIYGEMNPGYGRVNIPYAYQTILGRAFMKACRAGVGL